MKLMSMLAVAALVASSPVLYGQNETEVMTVHVPFAFTASGASMPAGQYVISHVPSAPIWRIQTFGRTIFLTVKPRALTKAPEKSRLIFEHDAKGYTLLQFQQQAQKEVAEVNDPARAKESRSADMQIASVTALGR